MERYATNEVIAKAETKIANFTDAAGKTAARYSRALCEKRLRCGSVHNEIGLKVIFR